MVSTRQQSGCSNVATCGTGTSSAGSNSPSSSTSTSTDLILHNGGSGGVGGSVIISSLQTSEILPTNHNHTQVVSVKNVKLAVTTTSATASSTVITSQPPIQLMQFPTELLEKILSYFDFKSISNLRLVNRRMDTVCGQILSSTFLKLQTTMLQRLQTTRAKMPRRESARRQHPLACESDIIEMLHMRLALLQMSFGKHIERKHCCFFAGEILDEIYRIINHIRTTPRLTRPYKVTDELFDLSTMAMEYFKEKIEPTLPEITYFGKSTDFRTSSFSTSKNDSIQCGSDSGAFDSSLELSSRSPPQSNMVLRKRIRKIKQGMKRYSFQLSLMRHELRVCRTKLVDQQKTVVEYANRLDDYDKKNEETSRKFSNVLQELNKCKTELQFFRSKFPFNPDCTCGTNPTPHQPLLANEPPLSIQEFIQVLSPQAIYNLPGSLDEISLESANIAVEVAAEPLTGSASPRADQDEPLVVPVESAAPVKKQGRGGRSVGIVADGHSSDSEISTRKQLRNTTNTQSAANNVSGNEDSGSDHEINFTSNGNGVAATSTTNTPNNNTTVAVTSNAITNSRKPMRCSNNNNSNQQCLPSTSVNNNSNNNNTNSNSNNNTNSSNVNSNNTTDSWNIRTKKRKSTNILCDTKTLRGATNNSNGFNGCKRSRR